MYLVFKLKKIINFLLNSTNNEMGYSISKTFEDVGKEKLISQLIGSCLVRHTGVLSFLFCVIKDSR